jgi:hypothetical protein
VDKIFWKENLKDNQEDLDADGRIILKYDGRALTGFKGCGY